MSLHRDGQKLIKGEALIRVSRVEKSSEINKRACPIIRHLRVVQKRGERIYISSSLSNGFFCKETLESNCLTLFYSTQFKTRGSIKSHQEAYHVFNSSADFSRVVFTNSPLVLKPC